MFMNSALRRGILALADSGVAAAATVAAVGSGLQGDRRAVRSFGYNTIRMGSYFKANTLSWTYCALNGGDASGLVGNQYDPARAPRPTSSRASGPVASWSR